MKKLLLVGAIGVSLLSIISVAAQAESAFIGCISAYHWNNGQHDCSCKPYATCPTHDALTHTKQEIWVPDDKHEKRAFDDSTVYAASNPKLTQIACDRALGATLREALTHPGRYGIPGCVAFGDTAPGKLYWNYAGHCINGPTDKIPCVA